MLYLESIDCFYVYIYMYIIYYPWKALSLSLFLGEVSPVHVISPKRLFSNCIHLILGKSSAVQYCNSPRHMMRSPHLSLSLYIFASVFISNMYLYLNAPYWTEIIFWFPQAFSLLQLQLPSLIPCDSLHLMATSNYMKSCRLLAMLGTASNIFEDFIESQRGFSYEMRMVSPAFQPMGSGAGLLFIRAALGANGSLGHRFEG